jgi:hypothetical protein
VALLILVVAGLVASVPVGSAMAIFTKQATVTANAVSTAASFPLCYRDAVLADNPVSYWRLEETSGTTAADSKGSNLGTYTNGPGLGQSGAVPDTINNRAVHFDGVNDYVSVPASASLNVASQITIEAWIYKDDTNAVRPIVEYGNSGGYGVHMWNWDDGTKLFVNFVDTGGGGGTLMTGPILHANIWYHVAASYDGNVGRLYVNGTQVAQATLGSFTLQTNLPVYIGRRPVTGDPLYNAVFAGKIDEVAVYSTALTAAKIRTHYNSGRCYKDGVLADSPTGYWRLGESSGSTASDSIRGRHGSYVGSPTLAATGALNGDSNTAVTTNGSGQYTSVPYDAALNPAQVTLEGWAKPTGGSGTARTVVASQDTNKGYLLGIGTDNKWRFTVGTGGATTVVTGSTVTLSSWAHVVGTYDGATAILYVNGISAGTASVSVSANTTRPLGIGATDSGGSWAGYFPGSLDEVAVYGSALSQSRVQAHYLLGRSYKDTVLDSGPISYWRLDEGSGTSAADSKGSNTGTYTNGPTLGQPGALAGDSDTGGTFDGVDDYVRVPNAASLNITGPFSIEAWIKVNAWDYDWQAIVTKGDSAYRLHRYWSSDNLSSGFNADGDVQGAANVNDGGWHYVVTTWDGSTKNLYVDGTLDSSGSVSGPLATNSYDLAIGENLEAPGRSWDGSIDEVTLYTKALSATEVQLHYDSGRQ